MNTTIIESATFVVEDRIKGGLFVVGRLIVFADGGIDPVGYTPH